MKRIDHYTEVESIKQKYGRNYHFERGCLQELSELWGLESNEHGVPVGVQVEELHRIDIYYHASFYFIESKKGYWLTGTDYSTSISGGGGFPSLYDTEGYLSYDDARKAAIEELIERYEREIETKNSCGGKSHLSRCHEMIVGLHAAKLQQLELL